MVKFLLRSFDPSDPGYREIDSPNGLLPRSSPGEASLHGGGDGAFTPWAITPNRRVVYARVGENRGLPNIAGLRPYDGLVSQDRRRLAESALGLCALNLPQVTKTVVDEVTQEMIEYIDRLIVSRSRKVMHECVFEGVGHYYYTDGKYSFGRISEANKATVGADGAFRGILDALRRGRLDQRIGVHETLCRNVFFKKGKGMNFGETDPNLRAYEAYGPKLRRPWFDDKLKRGRSAVPEAARPGPMKTGGVVTQSQASYNAMFPKIGQTAIARSRGVDEFQRDLTRTREPEADAYYDDLDARNLTFGAGISGTTGTCLQAAFAFSQKHALRGERLKQYVFAILGYLVGGGMHSAHESLAVAQAVGLPYFPGKYIPSLPDSFLMTPEFRAWRGEYYDIVVLGATHWRFNLGALPSHLNPELAAEANITYPRGDIQSPFAPKLAGPRK